MRDGFAIFEDVLPPRLRDDYVAELEHVSPRLRNLCEAVPLTSRLVELARELTDDAQLVRALLFDKTEAENWSVRWHQDRTIAVREQANLPGFRAWTKKAGVTHVQPPVEILEQMITVRLHLDDDPDDGALRVVRGSHTRGFITDDQVAPTVETGEVLDCHVPRGGALLMRPLLLHASRASCGAQHRRVVHLEFAHCDLPPPLEWRWAQLG